MVRSIVLILLVFPRLFSAPGNLSENESGKIPVLKSLILPGWGEMEMNSRTRSTAFFTSEFALWTFTLGSYFIHARGVDYYRALAGEHAGVNPVEKNYQYWVDIGNYATLDDFNDEHLRWRESDRIYPRDGTWDWTWDTASNRHKYERSRIAADRWLLTGKFMAGGLVLNHIISAIDVIYLKNKSGTHLTFSARPGSGRRSADYTLSFWF
ncbi:MAG: hypothetical protein ACE5D1_03110 [Fidelibacterota bacterium]